MIFGFLPFLEGRYQRLSTNRFIVDSPRFWREEFHPRFADIFSLFEFVDVFDAVNQKLSYPFSDDYIDEISEQLYQFLSGFRFSHIPAKNPRAPQMFLSELYFALSDILVQMGWANMPIEDDDFNITEKSGETGSRMHSRKDASEDMNTGGGMKTDADIMTTANHEIQNASHVENVDTETDTNAIAIGDTFLSPQNVGALPNQSNIKHSGVEGIQLPPNVNNAFTTAKNNDSSGESTKDQRNTTSADNVANAGLQQDNNIATESTSHSDYKNAQSVEVGSEKTDRIHDRMTFDKAKKLQEFYDLNQDRLWMEIINRISQWILQVSISTGERNYIGFEVYD